MFYAAIAKTRYFTFYDSLTDIIFLGIYIYTPKLGQKQLTS